MHALFGSSSCLDCVLSPSSHFLQQLSHIYIIMSSMHLHSSYVIPSVYENNFLQDVVVSLHASSKFTAVGLSNGEIYIFNLEGEHQRTLRGHEGEVWTMTSWEDSNILISGGHDTLLRIWDTATGCIDF